MTITENLKASGKNYVAFLDVLGFKEFLERQPERLDTYFNTIKEALNDINIDKPSIKYQLLSDSSILSCKATRDDLRLLLTAVQTIQTRCALQNIWLRGAISVGEIYFDTDTHVVVGKALSDAYVLESQEPFPRVILDPKILSLDFHTREILIQEYNNTFVGAGAQHRPIPLIHDLRGSTPFIANDALFVSFAERIAKEKCDNLEIIYNHVRGELYRSQTTYKKYLWLKNYFTEAIQLHGRTEGPNEPKPEDREKVLNYAYRFEMM